MNSLVVAYYRGKREYDAAVHAHTASIKDLKELIGVRFSQFKRKVWHRGHVVLEEIGFRAIATYINNLGKKVSRFISSKGWSLYELAWESGTVKIRPVEGSKNSKSSQEYQVSLNACSCPSFRNESGLIAGKCKHQRLASSELNQAPWIEQSIYAYPFSKKETFQIQAGLKFGKFFWLEAELNRGWDLKIMCRTRSHLGKIEEHCIGRIFLNQDEDFFAYSNARGTYRARIFKNIAAVKNLENAVNDLIKYSFPKDKELIPHDFEQQKLKQNSEIEEEDKIKIENLANSFSLTIGAKKREIVVERSEQNGHYWFFEGKKILTCCLPQEVTAMIEKFLRIGCLVKGHDAKQNTWYQCVLRNNKVSWKKLESVA